jgi:predicted nucleic acid-binding protein
MAVEDRLIDTNVLVYAYDVSEKGKRPIARSLLDEVWDHGGGVVTLQNLSEFFVVVTGKVQRPIPVSNARTIMDCAPPTGELSPRFEGSAIGGFRLLDRHLVFLRG